jgi:carbamoyl-phosphate synthase small subunit
MKFGHHGANHPVQKIPPVSLRNTDPLLQRGCSKLSPPLAKGANERSELGDFQVFITSQNHSFCVDEKTLPDELTITHISLFDKTLQGFKHKTLPVMAFQGHPEASPGPNDMSTLFDQFVAMLNGAAFQKPSVYERSE